MTDTTVTIDEIVEAVGSQIEDEIDSADLDIMPDHADRLLIQRVGDMQETITSIEVAKEMDDVELTDEEIQAALKEDTVDILLALAAFVHEKDMDLSEAADERLEIMEALAEAETDEERMEAMFGEEVMEEMGGPDIGDDVSRDDYEGEPRGFS